MPVAVTCHECQSSYQMPDELIGKSIRCPKCRAIIKTNSTAPRSSVVRERPVPPEAPKSEVRQSPNPISPKSSKTSRDKPTQPKSEPKATSRSSVTRPKQLDDLELFEDEVAPQDDDFFEDDFDDDKTKDMERRSASAMRTASSSRKSNRSRQPTFLSRIPTRFWSISAVVLVVGFLGWKAMSIFWSFRNHIEERSHELVEHNIGTHCKIQMPRSAKMEFEILGPGTVLSEMRGKTTTGEIHVASIDWNHSIAPELDEERIDREIREQWVSPWGQIDEQKTLKQDGMSGREFHTTAGDRQGVIRTFVNREGLIVLRVRNLPGVELAAKERDDFLSSLKFSDKFLTAHAVGRGIQSNVRSAVAAKGSGSETTPTPKPVSPQIGATARATNPVDSPPAATVTPAKTEVAMIETSLGSVSRSTRQFRVPTRTKSESPGRNMRSNELTFQPVGWRVPVEPVRPLAFDTSLPLNITFPVKAFSQKRAVIFGAAPGRCVLVGEEGNERIVWNLATREKLGTFPATKLAGSNVCLSSDGKWLVEKTNFGSATLTLWDVSTGRAPIAWQPSNDSGDVMFAGSDRLLTFGPLTTVYSIPNGKEVGQYVVSGQIRASAISPNGRLLAVLLNSELQVLDIDTGKVQGRLPLDSFLANAQIGFSADGTLLAVVVQMRGDYRLLEVNVTDGRVVRNFKVPQAQDAVGMGRSRQGPWLHGFPGNTGWLLGDNLFVRSDLEGVAWTFETKRSTNQNFSLAMPVTENAIVRIESDANGAKLAFAEVGQKALTATKEDIQESVDALLPNLTEADWSQVTEVLPVSQPAWKVPKETLANSSAVTPTLTFELGNRRSRGATLIGSEKLAILTQVVGAAPIKGKSKKSPGSKANDNSPFAIEIYDLLANAKKSKPEPARPLQRVPLDFPCDLWDVSPSGRFALVRVGEMDAKSHRGERDSSLTGRLDVIDLQAGTHAVGWRPYFDLFEKAFVIQAAFVDDQHILTISQEPSRDHGSLMALWKLPECRAVYVIQGAVTRTLSPNRRVLAISRSVRTLQQRGAAEKDEPAGLFLLDPLTGATLGHLKGGMTVSHAMFSPREARLLALSQHEAIDVASEWNLESGEISREFPLPSSHRFAYGDRWIAWTAPDQVLIDGLTVLDLKRRIYSAFVRIDNLIPLRQGFDQRMWFLREINSANHLVGVAVTEIPDAKMSETIQLAIPKPDLVLQPGMTVSTQFQLSAISNELIPEIEKRVRDQLELADVQIADGQPTQLVVSATELPVNESATYVKNSSPFGFFGRPPEEAPVVIGSIAVRKISCKFQIVRNGKVEKEFSSTSVNTPYSLYKPNEKTLQEVSDKFLLDAANEFLLETRLPQYIFSDSWKKGVTSWSVSPRGIEQSPNFGVFP